MTSFYISANGLCSHITKWPYSSSHGEQVPGRKRVEGTYFGQTVFLREGGFQETLVYFIVQTVLCSLLDAREAGETHDYPKQNWDSVSKELKET